MNIFSDYFEQQTLRIILLIQQLRLNVDNKIPSSKRATHTWELQLLGSLGIKLLVVTH
jgi:hypothetical protein